MKQTKFTFSKEQRLCREKKIRELFTKKSSCLFVYPFKINYLPSDKPITQILIAVSPKKIKTAVKRNRIKRQIRELYRLSQHKFGTVPLCIAVVYVSDKLEKYEFLQKKWEQLIAKMVTSNSTTLS